MADEIVLDFRQSQTLWFSLGHGRLLWNTSGTPGFEAENDAHIAQYAIPMSQVGGMSKYTGTIPSTLPANNATVDRPYILTIYQQFGSSPSLQDIAVYSDNIVWNGTTLCYVMTDASGAVATTGGGTDPNIELIKAKTDLLTFDSNDHGVIAHIANFIPGSFMITGYVIDGVLVVNNLPEVTTIMVARGTTFPLEIHVLGPDKTTAFDLTDFGAIFTVKSDYDYADDDTDHTQILKTTEGGPPTLTIPTPTNGIIVGSITPVDTGEDEPYVRFPVGEPRFHSTKIFSILDPTIQYPVARGPFVVASFGVSTRSLT